MRRKEQTFQSRLRALPGIKLLRADEPDEMASADTND